MSSDPQGDSGSVVSKHVLYSSAGNVAQSRGKRARLTNQLGTNQGLPVCFAVPLGK